MKKNMLIIVFCLLLLTGCDDKEYTVTFMDEGKELSKITVNAGDSIKNVATPKKDGYLFVTWLLDGVDFDKNTDIKEDIVLTASWTKIPDGPNMHTVTFNFGSFMKNQTVDDGEAVEKPKDDPVLEKHTFIGWYDGDELYDFNTKVTKDIILVAKFKKNRVIVNYDLNGGTGTTIEVEIDKGDIPERPKDPSKFGYKFIGWLLGGQPYNFDFPINDDTTIKANYVAIEYVKVTYDTDGGSAIKTEMVEIGSTLTNLPTPSKEGYTFKYWSYNGAQFDINTKINSDITLLAIYEEIVVDTPIEDSNEPNGENND